MRTSCRFKTTSRQAWRADASQWLPVVRVSGSHGLAQAALSPLRRQILCRFGDG